MVTKQQPSEITLGDLPQHAQMEDSWVGFLALFNGGRLCVGCCKYFSIRDQIGRKEWNSRCFSVKR